MDCGVFFVQFLVFLVKDFFIFFFEFFYLVLILFEKLLVLGVSFFFLIHHFLREFLSKLLHFCQELLLVVNVVLTL